MKLFLTILLLIPLFLVGQSKKLYSVKKQAKDFKVLKEGLLEVTGNPYLYTDSISLNALFDSVENELKVPHSSPEIFYLFSELASNIKCGHTQLYPSSRLYREYLFHPTSLPVDLTTVDQKIYATGSFGKNPQIKKGYRVIEINNNTPKKILSEMHKHISSDGDNTTLKNYFIAEYFNFYYYITFGIEESFLVKFINERGDTLLGKWSPKQPSFAKFKNKMESSKLKPHSISRTYGRLKIISDKNYCYFSLPTFNYKNEISYRAFVDASFKKIKASQMDYLVIDLRGNTGGTPQNYLMGYLTDKNSCIDRKECKNGHKPRFAGHYKKWRLSFLVYRFYLGRTRKALKHGKDKFEIRQEIETVDPELRCNKKIIVLIDGLTFSAGANLSANLREKSDALVIGEESGGSYKQGNTGDLMLKLPHTKFTLLVNPFYFNNCVNLEEGEAGLIPDIVVHKKFEPNKKEDPYIKKVEEFIRQDTLMVK